LKIEGLESDNEELARMAKDLQKQLDLDVKMRNKR
jgi:hypothetical protein